MNHPLFWKCIFLCFDICILKKKSSNCWYLLLDGMLYWQLFSILQDHLKIIRPYDPYTATVCALYFIFGVVCAFFGYRCFKAIMFLYGFIFGSIVVYLICAEEEVLPGWDINQLNQILSKTFLTEWSNALIAMLAGLLFGLITMLVQYVGLFMLGFHTGHHHLDDENE